MIQEYFNGISRQLLPVGLDWNNLSRAYAGRPYHNLFHLEEMVSHLPQHEPPRDPLILGVALLYHDIVYKPTRTDNEDRSARSAARVLGEASVPQDRIDRCEQIILATQQHLPPASDDGDGALLIDLDLCVLARDPAGYDQYSAAVRQEFWMVPGFVFRTGRTRVITGLLDRSTIFQTDYGREHYEAPARENLWRELRNL